MPGLVGILAAFWGLLQSGPPSPDADLVRQTTITLLLVGLSARAIVAPSVYFAARRRPDGREVWWGTLAAISPLIGGLGYLIYQPRPPPPAIGAWNPWVLCPFCGVPRGSQQGPCPRCGNLLPPMGYGWPPAPFGAPGMPPLPPPPPPPPPLAPRPKLRALDIATMQVIGAILLTFLLASVALYLIMLPELANPAFGQAQLDQQTNEPWFVLGALVLQDSIMIAIAFDQAYFRGRISLKEMGLNLGTNGWGLGKQIGVGILGGAMSFCVSSLAVQTLVNILAGGGQTLPAGGNSLNPRIASLSDYGFWVASGVVVAPLAEELFFRGYALGGFIKRAQENRGLLITAALFGAVHLNLIAFFPLMAAGLVLGWLRIKTGSLIAPIAGHATNNFIVMTLTLLGM